MLRGPGRSTAIVLPTAWFALPLLALAVLLWPGGCASSNTTPTPPMTRAQRLIGVRLFQNQTQLTLAASEPPTFYTTTERTPRRLNLRDNVPFVVTVGSEGWKIGATVVGGGEMVIVPANPRSLAVNGRKYRGEYRFVSLGGGKFDLVNNVDIDDYLKGVLRSELFPTWHQETYRAQAIAARTYALYEKARASALNRHWDVYDDQRSQVYGGLEAETDKATRAVDDTAGVVLVYGPAGDEHIFKTYFSSCCGGITQSVTHAFNEPYIEPLSDQNNYSLCSASPKFNWGPIVIRKDELTRRLRLWGKKTGRAEKDMALLTRLEVQDSNRWGRPVLFRATDATGKLYSLGGEDLRWAVNTDAAEGTTLYSSFVSIITDSDSIRFVEGHGWGHGVGMCQWCAEARARAGLSHEDIALAAYPRAKLVRAY